MTAPAELAPLSVTLQRERQDHEAQRTEHTVGDRGVGQAAKTDEADDRGDDPAPQAVAKDADAEHRHDEAADDLGPSDDVVHAAPAGTDEDPVRAIRGATRTPVADDAVDDERYSGREHGRAD